MAELCMQNGALALRLSAAEQIGAVHGDLRVPLSAVRRVEVLADAHGPADHGIKLGTRIPGMIEVGTVRGGGRNIFAAVLPDTPGASGSSSTGRSTTSGSWAAPTPSRWPGRSWPSRRTGPARPSPARLAFPTMGPCARMTARPAWPPR